MRGLLVLWLLAAALCGGCLRAGGDSETEGAGAHDAPPPLPQAISREFTIGTGVAEGTEQGSTSWKALVYNLEGGLVCMEFSWKDGRGDASCGSGTGPYITRDAQTTWVIGSTAAAGATWARIHVDGGQTVVLDVVKIAMNEGVGYYATSLEGGPLVTSIEVLDGGGSVLETKEIDN
jgi:hypothetical protein